MTPAFRALSAIPGRRANPTFPAFRPFPSLLWATISALAAIGLIAGCSGESTRDVRVTILDTSGSPVPGAQFYAEAYLPSGADGAEAFAFLTATAGDAGEVPDSAREPLKMPWRSGARIALVAVSPGLESAVLRDPSRRVESDGALLVVEKPSGESESVLARLAFPFEDQPQFAARIRGPEHAPLRRAFREVWERALSDGRSLTSREVKKLNFLRSLDPE